MWNDSAGRFVETHWGESVARPRVCDKELAAFATPGRSLGTADPGGRVLGPGVVAKGLGEGSIFRSGDGKGSLGCSTTRDGRAESRRCLECTAPLDSGGSPGGRPRAPRARTSSLGNRTVRVALSRSRSQHVRRRGSDLPLQVSSESCVLCELLCFEHQLLQQAHGGFVSTVLLVVGQGSSRIPQEW